MYRDVESPEIYITVCGTNDKLYADWKALTLFENQHLNNDLWLQLDADIHIPLDMRFGQLMPTPDEVGPLTDVITSL